MTVETQAVQTNFDRVAVEWDSNPARVALARGIVEAICQAVPLSPDLEALDFGAGTGLLTLGLLPYVARITAVDASGEMLKVLANKLQNLGIQNVTTRHCDIGKEPLPAAGYTLVVSSMVLHHLANVPRTLKQLRHCLCFGGWIALADLDAEDGSFHSDPTGIFHHGFDRNLICQWLKEAGFTEVKSQEAYRIARPQSDGTVREYSVFLITGIAF